VPPQWEMYDLKADPLEKKNLAYSGYKRTPTQEKEFKRLKLKLARVEKTRLKSP
jgi:choline-sulfatase